jgi:hypothetical protein
LVFAESLVRDEVERLPERLGPPARRERGGGSDAITVAVDGDAGAGRAVACTGFYGITLVPAPLRAAPRRDKRPRRSATSHSTIPGR